ncbi:EAL domain-containing protein [Lacticaseibacillus sharpeae]|uniref:Signal transduction diguanylate cyclase n=1 Tax=Lacticaseibacillus sharpeae JCM 1186 = DSM 20505 TaxID=1291052 RepID=A0A0R1ZLB9_9LACO|nr:EAL domain-containing protein [Lacticaseibacillus sharpeae]KRM55269.1 Signal transduction diguanylate cyclase [Lacticaseibacillus sharpeae JCM 1186 = DSM 20505]
MQVLTTPVLILTIVAAALAAVGIAALSQNLWRLSQSARTTANTAHGITLGRNVLIVAVGFALLLTSRLAGLHAYTQFTVSVGLVALTADLLNFDVHVAGRGFRLLALACGLALSQPSTPAVLLAAGGATVFAVLFSLLTLCPRYVSPLTSFLTTVITAAAYWLLVGQNGATYQGLAITAGASLLVTIAITTPQLRATRALAAEVKVAPGQLAVQAATQGAAADGTYAFFVQPMVDASSDQRRLMAYELLLREYDYANQRWIFPKQFDLDIDKRLEMMDKVLAHVNTPRLALNMTAEEFADDHIAQQLIDYVQTNDKLAGLILELTHAPTLAQMQQMAPRYHEADIRIAIDDVGNGNHFEGLQSVMPYIDGMKFGLQNLRREHDTANLDDRMHFWYNLAADYDIDFIMEGIENQDDEDYAKHLLGVQYLEGYYYGKPELPHDM